MSRTGGVLVSWTASEYVVNPRSRLRVHPPWAASGPGKVRRQIAMSGVLRMRVSPGHFSSSLTHPYRLALSPIQAQLAFAEYIPVIELATAIPIMSSFVLKKFATAEIRFQAARAALIVF